MSSKLPLICLIILVYITTSSVVHGRELIGNIKATINFSEPSIIQTFSFSPIVATIDLPIDPNVNCTLLPTTGRLQAPISLIRIPNFGEFMVVEIEAFDYINEV
ncbi:hypothetical protein H5410_047744 [Solanum commersonii]|uniref:Uncharacterized protein n=1 Tax=Solanum commersonii TaxID=4109 RepID=A0A9J5XJK7_SOLCO|nr:hypothetical protein H5410_047744 [Solanum commersonii]